MKTAIIISCEVAKAPYVQYYKNILNECNIDYDIISWNRSFSENNPLAYSAKLSGNSILSKLICFLKYINHVIKTVKKNKYDILIVHTITPIVLMSFFLMKYRGAVILDIRDYSPILKYKFFYNRFIKVMNKASLVCISSNGYKEWLPKNINYVLSHNVLKNVLFSNVKLEKYNSVPPIIISTLGQIGYYEQNIQLINNVRNLDDFELRYYGYGTAEIQLRKYVSDEKITNVCFYGKYEKEQEKSLYTGASFISCYCNDSKTKRTVMSNRFYLSLICGIPLIVTKNSEQAKIIEKYETGFSFNENDNIRDKITEYYRTFDYDKFLISREKLICEIRNEYLIFENSVRKILTK